MIDTSRKYNLVASFDRHISFGPGNIFVYPSSRWSRWNQEAPMLRTSTLSVSPKSPKIGP